MITGLASSWDGTSVAYSEFGDGPVQIWDLETRTCVAQFTTVLQAGGTRLAISTDGTRVAAAAYSRMGLAVYHGRTGERIWHRSDISKVQRVGISHDDTEVWSVSDDGPACILDLANGSIVRKIYRVRWMARSPFDGSAVGFDGRSYQLLNNGVRRLETAGAATPLAGAFSERLVCVSEVSGPVRCFEVDSGRAVRSVAPASGSHWTALSYVSEAQAFAAVRYPFEGREGGGVFLELFEPVSGRLTPVAELPSPKYVFCRRGTLVLGSHGDLRRTKDGQLLHHFGWFNPEDASPSGEN